MWHNTNTFRIASSKGCLVSLTLLLGTALLLTGTGHAGQCSEPPFVSASIIPNVLLVLDNSASMYDLAYVCNNKEEPGKPKCKQDKNATFLCRPSLCYDDTYDSPFDGYTREGFPGQTYYGYYQPDAWYEYKDAGYFEQAATAPAIGCLNRSESQQDYCVGSSNQFFARGNLLNWLTMSKLDVEKKVLTGGKYENFGSASGLLGESRGCVGRRFIKQVRCWVQDKKEWYLEGSGYAFAIKGPETDSGPLSFSPGGQTTIEVYAVADDFDCAMDDCLNAVTCFSTLDSGPFGQCKQYIKGCMDYDWDSESVAKQNKYKISAFVHSLLTCRDLARSEDDVISDGDIQSIQSICKGLYHYQVQHGGSIRWDLLGDIFNPGLVCSIYPYDADNPPDHEEAPDEVPDEAKIGIGWCYTGDGNDHSWGDLYDVDGDGDTSDGADCVAHQLLNFCSKHGLPEVSPLDPSNTLLSDQDPEYFYIPAMLVEAGMDALLLGDGDTPLKTMVNRRKLAEAPEGILHKVKSKVKLGLLATNPRGSAFEFDDADYTRFGYTSGDDLDGGSVLSAVELDNSTIIDEINRQPCEQTGETTTCYSNWTPIGETLYEGTRYFRGLDSAYTENLSYTSPVEDFCQSNNVVLISDSYSTMDENVPRDGNATGWEPSGEGVNAFNASAVLESLGMSSDFDGSLPMHGTTYGVAVAYWAHNYNGIWNPERSGEQHDANLNFYSIYALGGEAPPNDINLLWHIAKYGGFVDADDNDLPDPGEWDGHNYVEAKTAYELERALTQIFYEIASVGAAGAVATVTQEMESDDLIVRGGFETEDAATSNIDWKGHLEVYIPYDGCSEYNTQPKCAAVSGCNWMNNQCVGKMYTFQRPLSVLEDAEKFCTATDKANGYCWDAGDPAIMPAAGDRNVFTYIRDADQSNNLAKVNFEAANEAKLRSHLANDIDFAGADCDSFTSAETCSGSSCWWDSAAAQCKPTATDLINWVLGTTTYDGTTARNRNEWILGDVVYSTPVVVGAPSLASVDPTVIGSGCANFAACKNYTTAGDCPSPYCQWSSDECIPNLSDASAKQCFYTYRENYLTRNKVIYVGANDGMIHAFLLGKYVDGQWVYTPNDDPQIGKELWAYIPSSLLSELKALAGPSYGNDPGCKHRFMVDLSPQAWDVYIDHNHDGTREWRTVIVGGLRGGGDLLFALDVTDPSAINSADIAQSSYPRVLWEYSTIRNLLTIDQDSGDPVLCYSSADYSEIKTLPTSWSVPYVGRLNLSSSLSFSAFTLAPNDADPDTHPDPPTAANHGATDRWFAFAGGGYRVYESSHFISTEEDDIDLTPLQKPHLFIIDMETGNNILQYVWPKIQASETFSTGWPTTPESVGGTHFIPNAMANTIALDVWSGVNSSGYPIFTSDGAVDHIYVGDLSGLLWGLAIDPASASSLRLDIWETKNASSPSAPWGFRGSRQPITVTPSAALDKPMRSADGHLLLYFGTGKFDNIEGTQNDRNDEAKMSFYGLSVPLTSFNPAVDTSPSTVSTAITCGNSSSMTVSLDRHGCAADCSAAGNWTDVTAPCSTDCYACLLDLVGDGERVVDSALAAGGMVFFTTFIPNTNSVCTAGGSAYLYAVNYKCLNLTVDPFSSSGLSYTWLGSGGWNEDAMTSSLDAKAVRAYIGPGMPSRPILDSSGNYLFVQTSDARIHRIKIELPENPLQVKGWKEEN
ncbi:pilus assembly protein [Desulfoferrobacter suflitae]|uniref:pilus assembly protein n=1 Tax=Desulfoferrobacter suflitae TaxID=2865782 RepID=UPI002164CF19|nr:PilC/PilY family type IV pilus protein [Desulfoferrobacter suflitae]MCK8602482.1 PilC/PilY family type IV pilus protein [Desulfoferrobacter suflitae]